MPQLTDRAEVWRYSSVGGRQVMTLIMPELPCLITPVGGRDTRPSYAREADYVVVCPVWTDLRAEDELRIGRRTTRDGQVTARRFTVDGVHKYDGIGDHHVEAWCREASRQ